MANLNKLLLAGGFPPGNNSLNHFEKLFAQKVGDSGVITTATGNPVSIVTNKAQNAISTLLSYSPKQSGSGDPSPQNIRPIEWWTEANLGVNSETPTTTISLGGTYYGFTVDVERGVLRVTHAIVDLGGEDISWSYFSTYNIFFTQNITASKDGQDFMCEAYKKTNSVSVGSVGNGEGLFRPIALYLKNTDYSDANLFKQSLSGIKFVYELATPLELPLTPQTVALLSGNNTLWTDGDEVSITYRAKKQ